MNHAHRLATCTATLALAIAAAGCASTDHIVANRGDLLTNPKQMATLGEAIRHAQREGCLQAGSNRVPDCDRRLREWAEVIAPPELPSAPEVVGPATDEEER